MMIAIQCALISNNHEYIPTIYAKICHYNFLVVWVNVHLTQIHVCSYICLTRRESIEAENTQLLLINTNYNMNPN